MIGHSDQLDSCIFGRGLEVEIHIERMLLRKLPDLRHDLICDDFQKRRRHYRLWGFQIWLFLLIKSYKYFLVEKLHNKVRNRTVYLRSCPPEITIGSSLLYGLPCVLRHILRYFSKKWEGLCILWHFFFTFYGQ